VADVLHFGYVSKRRSFYQKFFKLTIILTGSKDLVKRGFDILFA